MTDPVQNRPVFINRKRSLRRGVALLPNLITTGNMFCGFYSIVKSFSGDYLAAAWLIIIAGFFDFADGRVARLTNTQSEFGVEYDSLSDLTTFCLAPAILVYNWALSGFGRMGLAVCFVYFACGALRLARYNVQAGSVEKTGFQGLPSPAAAGTVASFVIMIHHAFGTNDRWPFFLVFMTPALGLLMVSHVKYRSFKKISGRASFLFMALIIAATFMVILNHEIMLFVIGMTYIAVGIAEWIWTAPQRIRSARDVIRHFFAQRNDDILLYEDDDEAPEQETHLKIVKNDTEEDGRGID